MPIAPATRLAAHAAWDAGRDLEAGRLIFQSLSAGERVAWVEAVLRACVAHGSSTSEIDRVLMLAGSRTAWKSAHGAFESVRRATLSVEATPERFDRSLLPLLLVAETAAKVMYNATQPDDPFDEDSGCWLAPCLREFLSTGQPAEVTAYATRALLHPGGTGAA